MQLKYRQDIIIKYGLILTGIIVLLLIPGEFLFHNERSVCIFKNLTGIECPFCGMTRAMKSLLQFKIIDAFYFNPISLVFPFLLFVEIVNDIWMSSVTGKIRNTTYLLTFIGLLILFLSRIITFIKA